jgi:hypothetical protein
MTNGSTNGCMALPIRLPGYSVLIKEMKHRSDPCSEVVPTTTPAYFNLLYLYLIEDSNHG